VPLLFSGTPPHPRTICFIELYGGYVFITGTGNHRSSILYFDRRSRSSSVFNFSEYDLFVNGINFENVAFTPAEGIKELVRKRKNEIAFVIFFEGDRE
jgi:hypothetical protein